MMVNMLVKIWLYLTKAVITGDVDEVRVQSEEPNLKSLLLTQAFCFSAQGKCKTATELPFLVCAPSPVGEGWGEGTRPHYAFTCRTSPASRTAVPVRLLPPRLSAASAARRRWAAALSGSIQIPRGYVIMARELPPSGYRPARW